MLLELMAKSLQVPPQVLAATARRAKHAYKSYTVEKRNGGLRTVHHPSRKLKAVQRWLAGHVIAQWPVHNAAFAYRKGLGIAQHAAVHHATSFLFRLDFANFFPSLLRRHVAGYLAGNPSGTSGWTPDDKELFLDIVCRGDALTIGAPTSPGLSNALCHDLDVQLSGLAHANDAVYTRYADDLFFSTKRPNVLGPLSDAVRETVARLPLPDGLRLNESKTHHTSRKWRKQVTGLIITPQGAVGLGRGKRRRIRALVHRYETLTPEERSSLRGLLSYTRSIEPDLLNRLVLKYGAPRMNEILK